MKGKSKLLVILLSLVFIAGAWAHEDENKGSHDVDVVKNMRAAVKTLSEINGSLKEDKYFDTAVHFVELAKIFHRLKDANQSYGDPKEWKKIMGNIVRESLKAVGACAEEDKKAIQENLKIIGGQKMKGHKVFR